MSKSWKEGTGRVGSQQKKQQKPVRKTSAIQLQQLKQRGKKVLKKILPNQPLVLIKKLVQKGADSFKKQLRLNQQLLPLLTTNKIQSLANQSLANQALANQTQHVLFPSQNGHFEQMNRQLTSTMLNFQSSLSESIQNNSHAQLVRLQTDKCYQRIPKQFFSAEMERGFMERLLTRQARAASEARDQLLDHYDQVEFNVHQQVAYKMGIFMSFVSFLSSIGGLAQLSIGKIKGSRARNLILKEIVVQRAARVNLLRTRKHQLDLCLHTLACLKGLKKIEGKLIAEVQAKGRVTSLQDYPQYCRLHEAVKLYCCPNMLCKYWDLAYYIERSYHDSFSRSLKSYLAEIIVADEKQLTEIITPSKSVFATVSSTNLASLEALDESYELEEDVELVTKHNIEKEIVALLRQGFNKCTYSTDQLCSELTQQLTQIENVLYSHIIKPTQILSNRVYTPAEKKQAVEKLTTAKYLRVVELWSQRLKKVISRQISIIEKALKVVGQLGRQQPEKQEVIASYLMQILYITFSFIDRSMAQIISRKFKQQESDSIRQLLIYEQHWKELVSDLTRTLFIWQELARHFGQQDSPRVKNLVVDGLLTGMGASRRKTVELMVDSYNVLCIEKLPARLQEEEWKIIAIPPTFYNTLGEVLYGKSFTKEVQKLQQKLLSSSLLLEKNPSLLSLNQPLDTSQTHDQNFIETYNDFQVSETVVKIGNENYKIISSTIAVIEWVQGYLQWAEELGVGESVESTVLSKVMEFLMMYNTHIKELILNKAALNYGKIKAKSITGKHLLIAYSQLKLLKAVSSTVAQRLPNFKELAEIMCDRLQKTMTDISKKFRTILELSLRESINKLVVDPRKDVTSPVAQTVDIVCALTRSCEYVRQVLMSQKEISQFVCVNWCRQYLEQIRAQYKAVYRQIMNSNGTRKSKDIDWSDNLYWKFKELQYLAHNLQEMGHLLPGFQLIAQELELERTKLDRPQ